MTAQTPELWPILLYFAMVLAMTAGILGLSHVLGQRHRERATGTPYESGMLPTGSARLRFGVEIYLVAMFFVIFDLESVFIFAWAVAVRELGWPGYAGVAVFTGILVCVLVYLSRSGAWIWGGPGGRLPFSPGREVSHGAESR
jgi:NADH-quinone oxidoreductase subunit A